MRELSNYHQVVDELTNHTSFGLFEDGHTCYFQDGTQVSCTDLWMALRIVHHLPFGMIHKTLLELCPDTFVGTFPYKFSKHQWKTKPSAKQ